MKQGSLCNMIDENGSNQGICIFIQQHPPHTLPTAADGSELIKRSFWNWEVLHEGKRKFLNTSSWTLIEIVN